MLTEIILAAIFVLFFWGFVNQIRPKNFPPGPLDQWKIGGLPFVGYMPFLSPDPYAKIGKLGKKYGGIFSLKMGSYWFVVLNDYETIRNALRQDVFSGRPNHLLGMKFFPKGIGFNDGPAAQAQRRFSMKSLRDLGFGKMTMEDSMREDVQILMEYLRKRTNRPVELIETFAISAVNALWRILSSEVFDLDDPQVRQVNGAIKEGLSNPDVQGPLYFLPWVAKLFPNTSGLNSMISGVGTLRKLLGKAIKKHQAEFIPGSSPRDYIDLYLQQIEDTKDPESSFYKEEGVANLVDSLMNLFIANSDTLSCSISFGILYLAKCRHILTKVQKEIDIVVGRERLPDISDRPKLHYMEAVLNEILRFSSIVPGSILHSVMEDTEFMGYFLPKGTTVMPNLYQVHHDETYWGDPENFKPERFLDENGEFRKDERLIPFSIGKRACVGEKLAQTEFFLFLSAIIQNFDFLEDKDHPLPGFYPKSAFVLSPIPYKIVLVQR